MNARVTFDRKANAAYIYLRDIGPGEAVMQCSVECDKAKGWIILDLDKSGRLIGIEVLEATRGLPDEVLDSAERL